MRPYGNWVSLTGIILVLVSGVVQADGISDIKINAATGVTISTAGSYRLVSDVTMTANVTAVTITADDVTLDLNGHTIVGAVSSTNTRGVYTTMNRCTVKNGTIRSFGSQGVLLSGTHNVVSDVNVTGCNRSGNSGGIGTGNYARVENCSSNSNTPTVDGTTFGIYCGNQSIVRGCIASSNAAGAAEYYASYGIYAGSGSIISDNVAATNTAVSEGTIIGIGGGTGCQIVHNAARGNNVITGSGYAYGITAGADSVIDGNTSTDNDNLGSGSAYGIYASGGCLVTRNNASLQTTATTGSGFAYGIVTNGFDTIEDNTCDENDAGVGSNGSAYGISTGSGSTIRNNVCQRQTSSGSGIAAGISASSDAQIVGNRCSTNSGGLRGYGIRLTSTSNLITGNNIINNSTAGLFFQIATNNRAESNRLRQGTAIDTINGGVNPAANVDNLTY